MDFHKTASFRSDGVICSNTSLILQWQRLLKLFKWLMVIIRVSVRHQPTFSFSDSVLWVSTFRLAVFHMLSFFITRWKHSKMNRWSECFIDYVSPFHWGFCTSARAFLVLVICTYRIGHFCHSKEAKFYPWQWSVQTNPFKNIAVAWYWLKKIAFKRRCMSRHDSAVSAWKISTTVVENYYAEDMAAG